MYTEQLITLQKLAREKSFSRTSKELGISQPTVTMRIKALEDEIGQKLVLRTGQKAVLTPEGEVFLSYIDRALKVLQSGVDEIAANEGQRILSIAGTSTINSFILPVRLQKFQRFNSGIQLRISTGSSNNIVKMVIDGIVEIGLVRGPVKEDKNILAYELYPEEMRLTARKDHPLAKLKQVTYEHLKNEPLLIYGQNSATSAMIRDNFSKFAIQPNITMELEHIVTVKKMVLAGMGIAFLPEMSVREHLEAGQLQTIPLDGPSIRRHTFLVTSTQPLSPTAKLFIQFLFDSLQPLTETFRH